MIVVSIIALLVVIALPSFLRARQSAQNAKFVNAVRVASGAFETYGRSTMPIRPTLIGPLCHLGCPRIGPKFDWTKPTPIGGNWDWDYNVFGFTAGISVIGSSADVSQVTEIDSKIDDGDLSTGAFRDTTGGRYTYILE